jgi:tRNA modification GTPase
VAIVTEIAGTTRDLISVDLDLGGYLVKLVDTAGLRETEDIVEAEGVRRTRLSLANADLILNLKEADDQEPYEPVNGTALKVRTKIDKVSLEEGGDAIDISSLTGYGIDSLTKRIQEIVSRSAGNLGSLMVARQRQADLLAETIEILDICVGETELDIEVRSEYLRQASHVLGKLTGFVDVEDLLDVIFSEFCIGK